MRKLKILIVEDEVLLALALKRKLTQAGYEPCEPVASGNEAIESTRKENPDVVLMDIRLAGEMDGIEAAQKILAFSAAKIIFITGYTEPGVRARAMTLNPAAYLLKPIGVQDIDAALQPTQSA